MKTFFIVMVTFFISGSALGQSLLGPVVAYEREVSIDLSECGSKYLYYFCLVDVPIPADELPIMIADVSERFDFGNYRVFVRANRGFYELQIHELNSSEHRISWSVAREYFGRAIDQLDGSVVKLTTFKVGE